MTRIIAFALLLALSGAFPAAVQANEPGCPPLTCLAAEATAPEPRSALVRLLTQGLDVSPADGPDGLAIRVKVRGAGAQLRAVYRF